jgi:hypothetical protein
MLTTTTISYEINMCEMRDLEFQFMPKNGNKIAHRLLKILPFFF